MSNLQSGPITHVNGDGEAVKVIQVVSNGEQITAAGIGLFTGGPAGSLAAWGAIRMLAGKWTPWMLLGFVAGPMLLIMQLFTLGVVVNAVSPDRPSYTRSR